MSTFPTPTRTGVAALALGLGLAAVLSACGGSSTKAATPTTTATAPAGQAGGGGAFNGTSGTVAAISGSSMEVQNAQSGQTTVNWTASTRFTKTTVLALSAVTTGDCVTVTGSSTDGTFTARSVTISAAGSSGTCSAGLGAGGFGHRPGGTAQGSPGSTGSTPPRSFPGGGGARTFSGSFASGKVVSVGSTSMVIDGTTFTFAGRSRSSSPTSTPPTTAVPTDITIAVTSSTTYTETQAATSGSLAVGDCVTATGPADSTGAVTASSVRIFSPTNGSCSTGFGGFGRFGGAGSGGTGGSASGGASD